MSSSEQVHVLFFPLMAPGHMLPARDIASLFSSLGAKSTVITTPRNASFFTKSAAGIDLKIITFPTHEVGLPEGFENLDAVTSQDEHRKFFAATELLRGPVEQIVRELRPHAIVADMFFPWVGEMASRHGVPTLMFQGTSFFSMCAMDCVHNLQPYKTVTSDSEPFVLTGLPDEIKMTRLQIPDHYRLSLENDFSRFFDRSVETMKKCYGTIVNSFYELEPAYVDHYRKVLGRKAWHIGPVSLQRTKIGSTHDDDCLKWLDSKKPNSVVYVCFGTSSNFSDTQLREIAAGLEDSEQAFIWIVKKQENDEMGWLPEGFEKRMEEKGLIIRGWAPQVRILEHEAVGGFVTHCGWNSTLEGVSAGLPLVTWPVFAEQFYNEKLITEVLRIGVGVGAQKWVRMVGDFVKSASVEKAVKEIMVGERAAEMRNRANQLGKMAKRAVQDGGSSYADLGALLQDLKTYRASNC